MRFLILLALLWPVVTAAATRPNIIFILADDLGYGELGCYGQQVIQTPNLDRLAREGLRFTQFYAGATVCAPSRSVLLTGQHGGHTRVRGNAGRSNPLAQSLRPEDVTVAEVLKAAGYTTGLIGKWGLGDVGGAEVGLPRQQGFDYFFGYLNQHQAHNHFPDYLWRNEEKVPLPNGVVPVGSEGAGYATNAVAYADDLFADEALQFVARHREGPFFLYWAMVVPHANNERPGHGAEVPDFGPYAGEPWSDADKGHAAMITRMDSYVGRLLARLRELNLDRNTLVIFTSDNGPHRESGQNPARFAPSGAVRGFKRDLSDGGIRVPFLTWWPDTVKAGGESAHVGYSGDVLATAADLAGTKPPAGLDGISFGPTLRGQGGQPKHDVLYWEFHEGGFSQAVLLDGRWKAIRRLRRDAPVQLFDLQTDLREEHNQAAEQPALVARAKGLFTTARTDSPDWPVREAPPRP